MATKANYLISISFRELIVLSFLLILSYSINAQSPCDTEYPHPQLSFSETEEYEANGIIWVRYQITVLNYMDYDAALFATSPELPPCGINENSARTWVKIYNQDDNYIYGFCALSNEEDLQNLWFSVAENDCPPESVYIVFEDRLCEEFYISNLVVLPECEPSLCSDLIIESFEITTYDETSISYSYTIKNIGEGIADLNGPTSENFDNISIQCFMSEDTIFNNEDDLPAGGAILGISPLPILSQNETFSGSFSANVTSSPNNFAYLKAKIDWSNQLSECLEDNNFGCATIQTTVNNLEEEGWTYQAFPNPVGNTFLYLDYNEAANISIDLYDPQGNCLVKNYQARKLNMSNFPVGVYYLLFFDEGLFVRQQPIIKF